MTTTHPQESRTDRVAPSATTPSSTWCRGRGARDDRPPQRPHRAAHLRGPTPRCRARRAHPEPDHPDAPPRRPRPGRADRVPPGRRPAPAGPHRHPRRPTCPPHPTPTPPGHRLAAGGDAALPGLGPADRSPSQQWTWHGSRDRERDRQGDHPRTAAGHGRRPAPRRGDGMDRGRAGTARRRGVQRPLRPRPAATPGR